MDNLAAEMLDLARASREIHAAHVTSSGDAIEIVVQEGQSGYRLPLSRLAARLDGQVGADRVDTLRSLLAGAVESAAAEGKKESWDAARLLALRPMLNSAIFVNNTPRDLVASEVALGVAATVVVDRPTTSEYVQQSHLDNWAVTAEEVKTAAFDNLQQAPDHSRWEATSGGRIYERVEVDEYTATRLFTPGWLATSGLPGKGAAWFANPVRNVIMAGRVDDVGPGLERIADVTHHLWENQKAGAISPVVYTVDRRGAIAPLTVKRDPRATRALRRGQLAQAVSVYGHQLDRRQAPTGEHWPDIQVGRFDNRDVTLTAWTGKSTNDLLPSAEFLMIPPVTDGVLVPWGEFLAIAGEHVQREPGPIPARWRTCRPLTSDQVEQLVERSVVPKPA